MLPALNVMPSQFVSTTVASLLGPASVLAVLSTVVVLGVLLVGLVAESRRERRASESRRAAQVPTLLRPAA